MKKRGECEDERYGEEREDEDERYGEEREDEDERYGEEREDEDASIGEWRLSLGLNTSVRIHSLRSYPRLENSGYPLR